MKKNIKKGKNRKTAVPVLQVWTEEADALRTHMKPADLEDEEDAIIPVWQLGVKVVHQVDTEDFPALQKEPVKRQSLQEPKEESVGSSQVQVQIPEPEFQTEQPKEALEMKKEEPRETDEHPAQQTEVIRLQAELSRIYMVLQNQSLLWGNDRAILLRENATLCDALYHANMAVEMMKRQSTEDQSRLQTEAITNTCANQATNKDHQREEKDSCLLAETLKENATMKAALSQAKKELENKSREWEEERSFLLLVNEESIKLQDALHQAQEELREKQQLWKEDKSRLLKEQKETTSKLEADLRQAQIKTQCSLDSEERTKLLFRDMAQKAKLNEEQWEEDRSRLLAEREEETIMMQQAKMDLHNQKCEWEKERAQLLEEQKEALKIKTALNKAQEELKQQKLQWEQEKTSFRETLTAINESLQDEEKDRTNTENSLMDRLKNLETQVEEARKPPKMSFKKKFRNFFKRNAGTPSPNPPP
ncbi:trichohyalin-like [Notolabrus celidotus]|uniref:trichohyalin-like n=1 Tax=Notolabrus celidotus TaxID=1203425 RepID=UPI00148FAEA4|nr:trichohyalin-like [Notolabrus celidotus]